MKRMLWMPVLALGTVPFGCGGAREPAELVIDTVPRPSEPERGIEVLGPHDKARRLFHEAKARNICASLLGDATMHTPVHCPTGMAYDHGRERCLTPVNDLVPAALDGCRNGEGRCSRTLMQRCIGGAWVSAQTYASAAECERGLLRSGVESIFN